MDCLHCLSALSPLRTAGPDQEGELPVPSLHCLSALSPLRTLPVGPKVTGGARCLHCLSALSPLRTKAVTIVAVGSRGTSLLPFGSQSSSDRIEAALAFNRRVVFIAFRLSVLFGHRAVPPRHDAAGGESSLPFGSQSSSDWLLAQRAPRWTGRVFIAFRLSVLFGHRWPDRNRRTQRAGLHCLSALSPLRTRGCIGGEGGGRLGGLHCLSALSPLRTRTRKPSP